MTMDVQICPKRARARCVLSRPDARRAPAARCPPPRPGTASRSLDRGKQERKEEGALALSRGVQLEEKKEEMQAGEVF